MNKGTDESEDCYETIWTVGAVDVVEVRYMLIDTAIALHANRRWLILWKFVYRILCFPMCIIPAHNCLRH